MMDRRPLTDIDKLFPGRPGLQDGPNRKERRREKAAAARLAKLDAKQQEEALQAEVDAEDRPPLPESIWLITGVVHGMQLHTGVPIYRMTIERPTQQDELTIYSKEGAAPVEGGLLERMARPNGGEAAIWTDGKASKESIGGGYTFAAVPKEWGFPEPEPAPEPKRFENLKLGEPFFPVTEYRLAGEGEQP